MSEERLSKLQKWILKFLYFEIGEEKKWVEVSYLKYCSIFGASIEGHRYTGFQCNKNVLHVTFSRSLHNLHYKGLIEAESGLCKVGDGFLPRVNIKINGNEEMKDLPNHHKYGGMNIKCIYLTEEGRAKAKGLLNVKNLGLNSKERGKIEKLLNATLPFVNDKKSEEKAPAQKKR